MKLHKIAAILAFIIGAMAIFAGGQVIFLGKVMDYHVISWLPYYNFTMGVISFLVTAILIWKNHRYAMPAAVATLATHVTIVLVLLTAYNGVVAAESLKAMTVRITVWVLIVALLYLDRRKNNSLA